MLARHTRRLLSKHGHSSWRRRGRPVKTADGKGILMPYEQANQRRYTQLSGQSAGVGSQLARPVGVICLCTGALLNAAMGALTGTDRSESGLQRRIQATFCADDVILADPFYSNYFLIPALQRRGVNMLFAQNGVRITDILRGESLGTREQQVTWPRRKAQPGWMSAKE